MTQGSERGWEFDKCCGRVVDDRGVGWKSRSDIEWLPRPSSSGGKA